MKLLEKDIEVLDYIVKICFEKGMISADDLKTPKIETQNEKVDTDERIIHQKKIKYYRKYFVKLSEYDFITISVSERSDYMSVKSIDFKTERFIDLGGFKRVYKDQLKKEAYDRRIEKGNLASATNSVWAKKTYWWTFGIAIAGFIIGVIALIIAIRKP